MQFKDNEKIIKYILATTRYYVIDKFIFNKSAISYIRRP